MTKAARWGWVVTVVAATGVALVLAFVLALTGDAPALYERQFVWLFWLNIGVAAILALVVVLAAVRLAVRKRKGKFGSLLLIRLAGIFALVGVLPGALIYTVSYQFVSRSIEVWFDARVQGALDAGLDLGRGTLETLLGGRNVSTFQIGSEQYDVTVALPADERTSPDTLSRIFVRSAKLAL